MFRPRQAPDRETWDDGAAAEDVVTVRQHLEVAVPVAVPVPDRRQPLGPMRSWDRLGPDVDSIKDTMIGRPLPPRAKRRVMLVASTGGHLAQLTRMWPEWTDDDRVWVTFDKSDARSALRGERIVHAHHPTTRSLKNAARNLWLAVRVLRREQPDVVVSTGAGVALPFFVVARLTRTPTVYLEVVDRVDSRTLTGRLCRYLSTRFCVQWPEQALLYPGSEVIGRVM